MSDIYSLHHILNAKSYDGLIGIYGKNKIHMTHLHKISNMCSLFKSQYVDIFELYDTDDEYNKLFKNKTLEEIHIYKFPSNFNIHVSDVAIKTLVDFCHLYENKWDGLKDNSRDACVSNLNEIDLKFLTKLYPRLDIIKCSVDIDKVKNIMKLYELSKFLICKPLNVIIACFIKYISNCIRPPSLDMRTTSLHEYENKFKAYMIDVMKILDINYDEKRHVYNQKLKKNDWNSTLKIKKYLCDNNDKPDENNDFIFNLKHNL